MVDVSCVFSKFDIFCCCFLCVCSISCCNFWFIASSMLFHVVCHRFAVCICYIDGQKNKFSVLNLVVIPSLKF
jgi:hypothetical protein